MSSIVTGTDNVQQTTNTSASSAQFASAPEIDGDNTFDLDNNLDIVLVAEKLASEAKTLLNILNTQSWYVREKFRIELRKINIHDKQCSTYKMSLRIDPIPWFKYHAQNRSDAENFEQLYQNGHCYFEKVKSETEHYPNIQNEDKIVRLKSNNLAFYWCYNEMKGKTCDSKTNSNYQCDGEHYEWCPEENYFNGECRGFCNRQMNYMHFYSFKTVSKAIYQCRHKSTKLNRKEEPCLFQANPDYRIYADTVKKHTRYPYFVVSARPNATPVLTLNPIKHCSNEEYVQTCDAWQAVLQTLNHVKVQLKLDKLPINSINVNFGKWMSQKDDDSNRRYCHAHINIVLTRGTIDTIHGMYLSKGGLWPFRSLVGSVLPPENYRLEDAWELMKYMNIPMTHDLVKDNHESKNTVGALKTNSEKLEHECKDLRQLISDSKFDGQMIEKLEHECKDLRQLISDSKFDGQKIEKLEHECKDLRQLISDCKFDGQKVEKLEHECKDLRQLISDSKFDGQKIEKLEHECKDLRQLISDCKFDGQKVEKLEHECKDLRQLISDSKFDGQKIEESTNIGYVSKIGRRINDVILIQEMQKYSDENWNRFLFPWNRI